MQLHSLGSATLAPLLLSKAIHPYGSLAEACRAYPAGEAALPHRLRASVRWQEAATASHAPNLQAIGARLQRAAVRLLSLLRLPTNGASLAGGRRAAAAAPTC